MLPNRALVGVKQLVPVIPHLLQRRVRHHRCRHPCVIAPALQDRHHPPRRPASAASHNPVADRSQLRRPLSWRHSTKQDTCLRRLTRGWVEVTAAPVVRWLAPGHDLVLPAVAVVLVVVQCAQPLTSPAHSVAVAVHRHPHVCPLGMARHPPRQRLRVPVCHQATASQHCWGTITPAAVVAVRQACLVAPQSHRSTASAVLRRPDARQAPVHHQAPPVAVWSAAAVVWID